MANQGYMRYEAANIEAFDFASPEQQASILREVTEQKTGTADNGQSFSAIHANRDFAGRSLIVRPNSLFGSTSNTNQQYIASQYALAFPDRGYLSIDLPAHGASDKLTDGQRREISKKDGSIDPIVDAQIEAALDLVPDMRDIVLTGEAMGELFAVVFAKRAAEKGVKVRRLFGIDPIGMEDRSPAPQAIGYIYNAVRDRLERIGKSSVRGEQELEDAFKKDFVGLVEGFGSIKRATPKRNLGLMVCEETVPRLMLTKSALTTGIGMEALEEAIEVHPDMRADFVFAGKSTHGRLTEPVEYRLGKLRDQTQGRVQFDEWPNDGQDIGLARHQPRLISYIKDNL